MEKRRRMNNEALKARLSEIRAESELLKRKYAGDHEGYRKAEEEMQRKYSKRNEKDREEKMRKKSQRKERRS